MGKNLVNSDVPVTDDTLGIWNSSGLVGIYTIRLTIGDQNQAIVHVIANSGTYVNITSPSEGDTIVGVAQVRGYTIVPDFSSYTLEYGYGELPSSWFLISSSTKMVADYILGSWLVSYLGETNYALRLTVQTNSGQTYADTTVIFIKSTASDGWEQELFYDGSLSPAVGDIDGDGYDEVVVGIGTPWVWDPTPGGIQVFSHDGKREVGWPKDTERSMMCSPALGDLDNDGIDDIVICSEQPFEQGKVHVYLSSSPDWTRYAETWGKRLWSLATPVIADLEDDGHPEILTINNLGTVYAWRNNGQPVIPNRDGVFAQTGYPVESMGFPCLAVADLDRDGTNEVIAGAPNATCTPEPCVYEGGIYIWDIRGNLLLGPQNYPDRFRQISGIAVANIDQTKDLEIVVFGTNEEYLALFAFKKNGTQVIGYPIVLEGLDASWWYGNHPAIGDLDGDGKLEIVVSVWTIGGEARIYAWHQDGTPLGSLGSGLLVSMQSPESERKREALSSLGGNMAEVLDKISSMTQEGLNSLFSTLDEEPVFGSEAETFGSPVLADVNADGNVDIIVRAGHCFDTGYERVFAWDYEGNPIPGWPLYASAEASPYTFHPYTPVIADMDKDGKLNMVLVTSFSPYVTPKVISWEFSTNYDPAGMHWPKYMHDKWNSARYEFKPQGTGVPTGYMPGDANGDSLVNIADIVFLINYLFVGGPAPAVMYAADVNTDCIINIADATYLINYLFCGGPPPGYGRRSPGDLGKAAGDKEAPPLRDLHSQGRSHKPFWFMAEFISA